MSYIYVLAEGVMRKYYFSDTVHKFFTDLAVWESLLLQSFMQTCKVQAMQIAEQPYRLIHTVELKT